MKIGELRDFAIKNNLNVVGTGKDGNAVRKDFLLVCQEHVKKQRDIKTAETAAISAKIWKTSDGLIAVYTHEKKAAIFNLARILTLVMETSYESDISDDSIKYVLAEYNKLKKKSIKYEISISVFEKNVEKFKETYSYRIDDFIL